MTGDKIREFPGGSSVIFSPDSKYMLTGEQLLWDVGSKALLHDFLWNPDARNAVFSKFGHLIIAPGEGTVFVYSLADVQQAAKIPRVGDNPVTSIDVSPDGQRVLVGAWKGQAEVWDVATARELFAVKHNSSVWYVRYSPDGTKILTASSDGSAGLWSAADGHRLALFRHDGEVRYATFSPNGQHVLTVSRDRTAKLWNTSTLVVEHELLGHTGAVIRGSFSPDGAMVATASEDGTVKLWQVKTGALLANLRRIARTRGPGLSPMTCAIFSPDGRELGICDGDVHIWHIFSSVEDLVRHAKSVAPHDLTDEQLRQFFVE